MMTVMRPLYRFHNRSCVTFFHLAEITSLACFIDITREVTKWDRNIRVAKDDYSLLSAKQSFEVLYNSILGFHSREKAEIKMETF